jgi:hypothetical protein
VTHFKVFGSGQELHVDVACTCKYNSSKVLFFTFSFVLCFENPKIAIFSSTRSYFSNANVQENKLLVPVSGFLKHIMIQISTTTAQSFVNTPAVPVRPRPAYAIAMAGNSCTVQRKSSTKTS